MNILMFVGLQTGMSHHHNIYQKTTCSCKLSLMGKGFYIPIPKLPHLKAAPARSAKYPPSKIDNSIMQERQP
jgi:hypothetical protein